MTLGTVDVGADWVSSDSAGSPESGGPALSSSPQPDSAPPARIAAAIVAITLCRVDTPSPSDVPPQRTLLDTVRQDLPHRNGPKRPRGKPLRRRPAISAYVVDDELF